MLNFVGCCLIYFHDDDLSWDIQKKPIFIDVLTRQHRGESGVLLLLAILFNILTEEF